MRSVPDRCTENFEIRMVDISQHQQNDAKNGVPAVLATSHDVKFK